MRILIHSHARQRMRERGATVAEVHQPVRRGRATSAKFGRTLFQLKMPYSKNWNGKHYASKQIDAIASIIKGGWMVVTVIVKYF